MKTIGSVKEDLSIEKRISITPDTVKKYKDLGFSINLEKKYAEHLGINDEEYKKNGANINNSKQDVLEKSSSIFSESPQSISLHYLYMMDRSSSIQNILHGSTNLFIQFQ